jgi:hypothetical protein
VYHNLPKDRCQILQYCRIVLSYQLYLGTGHRHNTANKSIRKLLLLHSEQRRGGVKSLSFSPCVYGIEKLPSEFR